MAPRETRLPRELLANVLDGLFQTEWGAIQQLQTRVAVSGRRTVRERGAARRRQESLEAGLVRVTMVVRAIADLCVAKGLFTAQELQAQLEEADLADGVLDGGLDPELVEPRTQRFAKLQPLDPSVPEKPRRASIVRKKKSGRTR